MFCEYKDIFGKPGEGFHSTRLFGMAANDLIGTIIIILIAVAYFNSYYPVLVIPLATVFIHKLFCVETAFNKFLFQDKEKI